MTQRMAAMPTASVNLLRRADARLRTPRAGMLAVRTSSRHPFPSCLPAGCRPLSSRSSGLSPSIYFSATTFVASSRLATSKASKKAGTPTYTPALPSARRLRICSVRWSSRNGQYGAEYRESM
ncbi:hypothetical protein K469DRAFT_788560 [Zopfia rhizophila CBS 207.26]|uniref:Uncharacterized protein n=1 Tax=Zopfia rhizophila CBS 207.26 TaxID=1314779 RepID=A0A6A6DS40_9PEZI|nr:hypothetical protein K469DRAFT_788560 [Zopfia rhizophila CBS 207.26]